MDLVVRLCVLLLFPGSRITLNLQANMDEKSLKCKEFKLNICNFPYYFCQIGFPRLRMNFKSKKSKNIYRNANIDELPGPSV